MADEQSRGGPPVGQSADSIKAETPEAFAMLPAGISAWVGALQLTVLLAATGFIGKVSLQQFLGIDLGNWTASDLSLFAGHWAFDTLKVVLQLLITHPFRFGWPVALYLMPLLLSYVLPARLQEWRRISTMVSVVVVLVSLTLVLARYEVPTLLMNDWLTTPLKKQLSSDGSMLEDQKRALSARLLVSKMNNLPPGSLDAGSAGPTCAVGDQASALQAELHGADSARLASVALNEIYAYSVLFCVIAWFAVYFHAAIDGPGITNEVFRGLRLFLCLLLLPAVSCLVPYMYAKLIYQTTFSLVSVQYKDSDDGAKEKRSTGEKAAKAAVSASSLPPPSTAATKKFLVMDETDKDISLLLVTPGETPYIQIEGRDGIASMYRYKTQDVINNLLLSQCNAQ